MLFSLPQKSGPSREAQIGEQRHKIWIKGFLRRDPNVFRLLMNFHSKNSEFVIRKALNKLQKGLNILSAALIWKSTNFSRIFV